MPTIGNPLDLRQIRLVISNSAASLRGEGFSPVYSVACAPGKLGDVKAALRGSKETVSVFERKQLGSGAGFLEAVQHGINLHSPDLVMSMLSDFELESKYAARLLRPIYRRGYDFATGAWIKAHRSTALEVPLPQYLNETRVSAAVSFANPNSRVSMNRAATGRRGLQTYTGLLAFKASAWEALLNQLETTFSGAEEHVHEAGVEPALVLSAVNSGLRVANAPVPRGYEHPFPSEANRQEFIASRVSQFHHGIGVVKHFLRATSQQDKLAEVARMEAVTLARMKRSPLVRRNQARLEKKFRPRRLYLGQAASPLAASVSERRTGL